MPKRGNRLRALGEAVSFLAPLLPYLLWLLLTGLVGYWAGKLLAGWPD
jgi:hypothetical protein